MNKLKQLKDQKGFTIIEVLIVLAIAGLILLIVFLAVPSLQRNQRNTARKNDVSRLGGASTEYLSDNNGTIPAPSTGVAGCSPPAAGNAASSIYCSAGTLSQYTNTDFSVVSGNLAKQPALAVLTSVNLATGAKCGVGGATAPGTARQMAIQYMAESSGNNTPLCVDI